MQAIIALFCSFEMASSLSSRRLVSFKSFSVDADRSTACIQRMTLEVIECSSLPSSLVQYCRLMLSEIHIYSCSFLYRIKFDRFYHLYRQNWHGVIGYSLKINYQLYSCWCFIVTFQCRLAYSESIVDRTRSSVISKRAIVLCVDWRSAHTTWEM